MMPKLEDVAKRAGTSKSAVSLVISKKDDKRISGGLKKKIVRAMEELDYHPHLIARGLASRRTFNVGVALRSIDYLTMAMYFPAIVAGIAHEVGMNGYRMQFAVTDETSESSRNLSYRKYVNEMSLDGLLIIDQLVPDEDLLWLKEKHFPFVLVDRRLPEARVSSVRVDNRAGVREAVEHLLRLGHRKVGFFSELERENKIQDMLAGYRDALKAARIEFMCDLIVPWWTDKDQAQTIARAVRHFMGLKEPPTGIVVSADQAALALLGGLRDAGVSVPGDMAVVGYNDEPGQAGPGQRLTTVRVPLRELGVESARLLFRILDREEQEGAEVVLQPELIVRETCGSGRLNGGARHCGQGSGQDVPG